MIINKELYIERINKLDDFYWNKELQNGFRRWEYFQEVIKALHQIPNDRVLEIGVYKMPLTTHSDVLDMTNCDIAVNMYKQDAGKVPWSMPDKYYDVVIANQVFEHLQGNQAKAWEEVQRVANYALVTIPWGWNCPTVPDHHDIGWNHVEQWFGGYGELYYEQYINERQLLCYKF